MKHDDSVVGPVERTRAHAEGLLHRSGMVFLKRSDGRILIQRRSASKETFPDQNDSSCSFHVTFGESYEDAARRELVEEVGISAPLRYIGKFIHNDPPENEIVAVFDCTSDDEVRLSKEESSRAEFYAKEEVDRLVLSASTPWLRDGWKLARDCV